MVYPVTGDPLVPSPNLPELENRILAFWRRDDTFRASIAQREGAEEYVFSDGPPFANGLPHYGHGLPAELEAMRELGMTEKSEIEAMGIGEFNAAAQGSVLKYTKEWEEYVERQARWVDFENDYKTLSPSFMESVLWAFKTLYDKD